MSSEKRPLRILMVLEAAYPAEQGGGAEAQVRTLSRALRARGQRVTVLCMRREWGPQERVSTLDRVPVCRLAYPRIPLLAGPFCWLALLFFLYSRRGRYDVVHVHSPLTPVLPMLAIEEAECPVVGTFHTYFDRSIGYTLGRRYFQKRLDMLSSAIAVSQSTTVALDRYFDANWKIIPNGIDTDVFNPAAPAPRGFPRDVPTILFLGRFDPRNGLSTLIDAFRHVKGDERPAKLVVVGDGPLRDHYYRLAGGDPDILFVGAVLEGRPSYYAHSSVYACPTTKASFGITLLESMACETPVVCSDILGFRDVVVHDREALMHPCGDHRALADSLVRILDDPALAMRLGSTGRQNSLSYSWARVTSQVLDVYRSVLGHAVAEEVA